MPLLDTRPMNDDVLILHGPALPQSPVVLDSPHSGRKMPSDFHAALTEPALRDGEDCFIDELYLPATAMGIPLLAAQFPRTYLDPNRHAADIDLDLLDGRHWPDAHVPSGKARIGKALLWRTLDDGTPIYDRKLTVQEVRGRIERYHRPYHETLRRLLDAAHAAHGVVLHLNCHSMNPVSGANGEGGPGKTRADVVLGDRDGTSCDPSITEFVRGFLAGCGLEVKINDPFKGVELVRAYSDPGAGRHSLQVEVNKRLYMDMATGAKHDGFDRLQRQLMQMLRKLSDHLRPA